MSESMPNVAWHVSTRSPDNGGNCVEAGPVLDGSGRVAVRDSKDRAAATLVYSADRWTAFVTGVKDGVFARTHP
ncbi:DUF397 domain-containing protein [Micromonospora sp. WMMD961]|uniref:DUF397 domain-containing protein n=1 Tax=Micromonospora sp. WMMD961 TaxID=3016100 RepID=UPI002416C2C7|nr:DUF397 domain-containing protein [Micromonospora sp. WMMD961]MDG4780028.1 DUF397 domain-containing protein [Micromonospora sp. WMMD961]